MSTEPIRDINQLSEPFKSKLVLFLEAMSDIDPMTAHETFRTQARQDMLRKEGKSWVSVSNHQLGKAADLHFDKYPHFPDSKDKRWRVAWDLAKTFGIDNGQDLWGFDGNHFQDDGEPYVKPSIIIEEAGVNWHRCDVVINILENLDCNDEKIVSAMEIVKLIKQSQNTIAEITRNS